MKPTDRKINGQRLREARRQRLWTIEEAARQLGVSEQTYIRWEQSLGMPHPSSLALLCSVFQLSPEELSIQNETRLLRLRQERERLNWTHRDVADRIGLPDSHTVGRWERGQNVPTLHYRDELCRIFGKSAEELGLEKMSASSEMDGVRSRIPVVFNTLPTVFTSIIGREQEITKASALLLRPDVRLLTLLGVGGVGKTRLAIEIAMQMNERFGDGVCFVALDALRDPAAVLPTIAVALGIKEGVTYSLMRQIKNVLHAKQVLLFLDNMEHVIEAAPLIEELLQECPGVKVLVTSRQKLQLQGEHLLPVHPLSLPDLKKLPPPQDLLRYMAILLFVERAQMSLPLFTLTENNAHAIAELCSLLDGLPLALELAAAHVKLFTPQQLLNRVSQDLSMLMNELRTAPERQRRLDVLMQWSYDLLNEQEQWVFRHLGIFVGGASLETMEAMFGRFITPSTRVAEIVASLFDKSLLMRAEQPKGELRFVQPQMVRRYALDCLVLNDELKAQMERYAAHYLALIEQAVPHLKTHKQAAWLARLEPELDNLRAVLQWLIDQGRTEQALQFGDAFGKFCGLRGYWYEERGWLEKVLALPMTPQQRAIRGRVLRRAGHLAYRLSDLTDAQALMEESIACSRAANDRENLVGALLGLAWVLEKQQKRDGVRQLFDEGMLLAEQCNDPWVLANALENLGSFLFSQGQVDEAYPHVQKSVTLARKHLDNESVARFLMTLAKLEVAHSHMELAMRLAQESLTLAQKLGTLPLIGLAFETLGEVALFQDASSQARSFLEECIAIAEDLGDAPVVVNTTLKLADIALMEGDSRQAEQLVEKAWIVLQTREEMPKKITAISLQGDIKRANGERRQAMALYQEALQHAQYTDDRRRASRCLIRLAEMLLEQGEAEQAVIFFSAAESWLHPLDLYPRQRVSLQQAKERAREVLGEQRFAHLWSEGVAASLQKVAKHEWKAVMISSSEEHE